MYCKVLRELRPGYVNLFLNFQFNVSNPFFAEYFV
jgi:hypothetical protein